MDATPEPSVDEAQRIIAVQATRIFRLEAENTSLKGQIERLKQKPSQPVSYSTVVETAASGDDSTYTELRSRYQELATAHGSCHDKISAAERKCRDYKLRAKQWKDYCDVTLKKQEEQRADPIPSRDQHVASECAQSGHQYVKEQDPGTVAGVEAESSRGPADTRASEKDVVTPTNMRSSPPQRSYQANHHSQSAAQITSSQTTVDDTQNRPLFGTIDSSDDEPTFVSARSLKRKTAPVRHAEPSATRIKQEPTTNGDPIDIDLIPTKKTPSSNIHLVRAMGSDLDVTRPTVDTTRTLREGILQRRATSQEARQATTQLERTTSSLSDGELHHFSEAPRGSKPRSATIKADPGAVPQGVSDSAGTRFRYRFLKPGSTNVLSPISGNVSNAESANPRRRRTEPEEAQIGILSEDGDESSQVVGQELGVRPRPDADAHLKELLDEPPCDRTPNLPRREPRPKRTSAHQLVTPVSLHKGRSPEKRSLAPERHRGFEKSPPAVCPEDEPLRIRDVRLLRLQDFKINPRYQGTDYAFADTLRGRDQRRTIHVCTRADCCGGALQKVVAMGGPTMSGKTDLQALEAFLGPDHAAIMHGYDADRRKHTILQAHTHCFAEQCGKHRKAFERPKSPPGFWRTDFPTTQEMADDRRAGLQMEIQEIEARYREAMRDGGKWIFRDER